MILREIVKLEELSIDFAQVIFDSKKPIDTKRLFKAKKFDSLFAQLYFIAHELKVTSEERVKDLFDFLGDKINAPNKEEYVSCKTYIEEHLNKNI